VRWVTQSKLTAERGFTAGQIKARVQRQHWRQGIEWARVDGSRLFDLDAIDARASEIAASQRHTTHTHGRQMVRLV